MVGIMDILQAGLVPPTTQQGFQNQANQQGLVGLASGLLQASAPGPRPIGFGAALGAGLQGFNQFRGQALRQGQAQQLVNVRQQQEQRRQQAQQQKLAQQQQLAALLGGAQAPAAGVGPSPTSPAGGAAAAAGRALPAAASAPGGAPSNALGLSPQQAQTAAALFSVNPNAATQFIVNSQQAAQQTKERREERAETRRESQTFRREQANEQRSFARSQALNQRNFQAEQGRQTREAAIERARVARENKPMSADQSKAAGFADRLILSNSILNTPIDPNDPDGERIDSRGGDIFNRAGNLVPGGAFFQSKDFQSFQQAKDDFINATLRRESGAAISDAEYERAEKQYFPQPGNKPQVIEQKRRNREAVTKGIRRSAGKRYEPPEIPGFTAGEEPDAGNVPQIVAPPVEGGPITATSGNASTLSNDEILQGLGVR